MMIFADKQLVVSCLVFDIFTFYQNIFKITHFQVAYVEMFDILPTMQVFPPHRVSVSDDASLTPVCRLRIYFVTF